MVFVSFKIKQILQMLWTSVIGDKRALVFIVLEGILLLFGIVLTFKAYTRGEIGGR